MTSKCNLYIDLPSLEVIAQGLPDRQYMRLTRIMHDADLIIGCDADTYETKMRNGEVAFVFLKANAIDPYPDTTWYDEILNSPSKILEHRANSVFFIDIPLQKAHDLRNEFGVEIYSKDEIDDYMFDHHVKKIFDEEKFDGGWDKLIDLYENKRLKFEIVRKTNSMVVYDNYLLQNKKNEVYIGLDNLKRIIERIVPYKPQPYYILILCPPNTDEEETRTTQEVTDWITDLKSEYPHLVIEFVFIGVIEKVIHRRVVLTGQYEIELDKGVKVFLPGSDDIFHQGDSCNRMEMRHYLQDPFCAGDSLQKCAHKDIKAIEKVYLQACTNQKAGKKNLAGSVHFVDSLLLENRFKNRLCSFSIKAKESFL